MRLGAKNLAIAGALAGLLLAARPAAASTITFNFEELALATTNSISSTQGGVTATIRRQDNGNFTIADLTGASGPVAFGSRTIGNFIVPFGLGATFVIDFSAPVTSASFSFGDFGGDDDANVFFSAFAGPGGTGTNLGLVSVAYPASLDIGVSDGAVRTLTVGGGGILSLTIVSGGPFPGSLYYDNLVVETAAVPEPASMVLLGTGVLGLLIRQRLRRRG